MAAILGLITVVDDRRKAVLRPSGTTAS